MKLSLHDESGLSLIEVIVTALVLSLTFVAFMSGLWSTILASDLHRKRAGVETLLRSYAEHIETEDYVAGCAASYGSAFSIPPAYQGYAVSVTAITFWNGDNPSTYGGCSNDSGVQQLTLEASFSSTTTASSVNEARVVYKRCIDDPPVLICPRL